MSPAPRRFTFLVTADEAGERIDRVCAQHLAPEGVTRSSIEPLFGTDAALVNDRPAKASQRVREGDSIVLVVPPPEPLSAAPENIALSVLWEDDDVLVVNKPAGLVVHPARGHASGTLVNAVLFHARVEHAENGDEEGDAALRPGIVHRLDKDTSGVLVIAKTVRAREDLKKQFHDHSIERSYLAITVGLPPDDITYDTLHGRHATDRKRFSSRVREGKRAVTRVQVLERLARGSAAYVRCTLLTGRTHQIRVHLADAGFPLLGDPLYGKTPRDLRLRAAAEALGRQALHAEILAFVHPATRDTLRFVAPPPNDFREALASLRD